MAEQQWYALRCEIAGCKAKKYANSRKECYDWYFEHLTNSTADSHMDLTPLERHNMKNRIVAEECDPAMVEAWETWERSKTGGEGPTESRSRSRNLQRPREPTLSRSRSPKKSKKVRKTSGDRTLRSPIRRGNAASSNQGLVPKASAPTPMDTDMQNLKATADSLKETVEKVGQVMANAVAGAHGADGAMMRTMAPMAPSLTQSVRPQTSVTISAVNAKSIIDSITRAQNCASTAADVCFKAAGAFRAESVSLGATRTEVERALRSGGL